MAIYLNDREVKKVHALVNDAASIVITSHKTPDGDAVGSALGLYNVLRKFKENVRVVLPDAVPGFLQWMNGFEDIVFFDRNREEAGRLLSTADVVFNLDYNALHRTGEEMGKLMEQLARPSIMIDHHQQPADFPVVLYSDTSACSTCEMIFRFLRSCEWLDSMDNAAAECLYCGIVTDSGSFRFPSVSPETHEIVAYLIENGLDHASVHRKVYDTNSLNRLRLIGFALSEKLQFWPELSAAVITLTREELKRFHHKPGDTEGLVNQALSIDGVIVAVFLREEEGKIKVSFRSKGNFDVNRFARESWNGGGHMNAAGGSTTEKMEDAVSRLKSELSSLKEKLSV